jgi:hypothetical protein
VVAASHSLNIRAKCEVMCFRRSMKPSWIENGWITQLTLIFHELLSRDRGEGCTTGQPQGIGAEAYLNSTSQGPIPEDSRKDAHIRGRSRQFVKYQGKVRQEPYQF